MSDEDNKESQPASAEPIREPPARFPVQEAGEEPPPILETEATEKASGEPSEPQSAPSPLRAALLRFSRLLRDVVVAARLEQEAHEVRREASPQEAALRKETERLSKELEQRDGTIARLSEERNAHQVRIEGLTSELRRAREQFELEKTKSASYQREFQQQLAELRKQATAQADKSAALELEKNLLQQSLDGARKETAEFQALLAQREAEFRSEQQELRAQVDRWQQSAAAATESLEQVRQELQGQQKQKEKEVARLAEQAGMLRGELQTLRARVQELEKQLSATESLQQEQAQMQRELKRKGATLAAVQEEYHRLQTRASEMENVLRELYAGIVNPLTIASASVDLLPAQSLRPQDAETIADLKGNIRVILQVLNKLAAKMSEMAISIEIPAASPGAHDQNAPAQTAPKSEKPAGHPKPRRSGL